MWLSPKVKHRSVYFIAIFPSSLLQVNYSCDGGFALSSGYIYIVYVLNYGNVMFLFLITAPYGTLKENKRPVFQVWKKV